MLVEKYPEKKAYVVLSNEAAGLRLAYVASGVHLRASWSWDLLKEGKDLRQWWRTPQHRQRWQFMLR